MNRRPVSSANILSVGWQESEEGSSGGTLEVAFRSGHIYSYANVPESTYQQLLGASSVGKTFNATIKDRYEEQRVA
jgi:KTSC domain-containing protein